MYIHFCKYVLYTSGTKIKIQNIYNYVQAANAQKCKLNSCSCLNPIFNSSSFNLTQ